MTMYMLKRIKEFFRKTGNKFIRRFKNDNDDFFSDNPYVIF